LVKDGGHVEGLRFTGENLLPLEADADLLLEGRIGRAGIEGVENRTGVPLGLHQGRHEIAVEGQAARRRRLELDQPVEWWICSAEVTVLVPPRPCLANLGPFQGLVDDE